ncbi:ABC transporter permease [Marininema halotolerans]|uniref:Putative ABC transport system permease protein n=1 Tax=Marininema halotolerans TaxID=1155944 RepID=A0A1I6NV12_9BACL|nr:ABC transporter permease [Marininema halotolerans]SFS31710.1 putative ABC transport system permease protein [Marininema halotolerans]
MGNQFLLALKDLWRQKGQTFILLVQIMLVIGLIQFAALSFIDLHKMKEEVKKLTSDKEIYGLMDLTSEKDIDTLMNDDKKAPVMRSLYEFIFHNKNFSAFRMSSNSLSVKDPALLKVKGVTPIRGQSEIEYVMTTEKFLDYFRIDIAKGRRFVAEDYVNKKTKSTPVLIGSRLAQVWDVGDIFTDAYGDQYKVIGILKEGATYIDIMASREIQQLDSMMISPVNDSKLQYFSDYDDIIPGSYIVSNDEAVMKQIVDYAAKLKTYAFAYKSMSQQVKHVIADKQEWIQIQLFLLSLVMSFTLISLIVSLLQFVAKNRYEFGIHYLTGATDKYIIMRITFQLLPLFIIGNLVNFFIDVTVMSVCVTFLASIVLGMLAVIIPVMKIRRMGLSSILRWKIK